MTYAPAFSGNCRIRLGRQGDKYLSFGYENIKRVEIKPRPLFYCLEVI
jgi:hypothetical protein